MRLHSLWIDSLWIVAALGCQVQTLPAAPPPDPEYQLVLQTPPATAVDGVAVSPDGKLVASVAGEGGVRLYDAQTGTLLRTIDKVGDRGVAFSPDGKTFTAAGFHMDKLVGVFDTETGRRLLTLPGHTEWEAYATALSPDGKLLASAGADQQILVWELPAGKLRLQLKNQPQKIAALAFSPDGSTLASGSDRAVRLWDTQTGRLKQSLSGHSGWVAAIAFAPSGKQLASASCDWGFHRGHDWPRPGNTPENSEWKLWDLESGTATRTVRDSGRQLAVTISPDGHWLACGLDDEVRLYDIRSEAPHKVLAKHAATVTSLAFTPAGDALISGSHDHTVKRTNIVSGRVEWQAPGHFEQVNSVALSADASLLITGSSDGRFARTKLPAGAAPLGPGAARLWDLRTGNCLRQLGDPAEQILAVALSADGRYAACGGASASGTGVVRVWETATGNPLWSQADHEREVLAVAFAPDGLQLASGSSDGVVKIRDIQTGSSQRELTGHAGGASSLVYSSDGKTLVCGAGHGATLVWDAHSGRLLQTCETPGSQAAAFRGDRLFTAIGLSNNGQSLATCTSSTNNEFVSAAEIWDPHTGQLKRSFAAEKIHGRPMALSPDGTLLATGGKSVKLWDVRTGKAVRELYGHLKRTQSIVFSADGRLLVAGGSYGTTNVWDVASGRLLVTLFAFSQDPAGKPANDWLAYQREGYFTGSPGIERYLAWRVGEEMQSTTLFERFHQPGRIAAALAPDSAE